MTDKQDSKQPEGPRAVDFLDVEAMDAPLGRASWTQSDMEELYRVKVEVDGLAPGNPWPLGLGLHGLVNRMYIYNSRIRVLGRHDASADTPSEDGDDQRDKQESETSND